MIAAPQWLLLSTQEEDAPSNSMPASTQVHGANFQLHKLPNDPSGPQGHALPCFSCSAMLAGGRRIIATSSKKTGEQSLGILLIASQARIVDAQGHAADARQLLR